MKTSQKNKGPTSQEIEQAGKGVESAGKGVLYGAGALALIAGVTWASKALGNNRRQEEKKQDALEDVFTSGTPAYYANRLFEAIDGIGTDNDEVFAVIREIPTQAFFGKVIGAYSDLTKGDSLDEDLINDLSASEQREFARILNSKPAR